MAFGTVDKLVLYPDILANGLKDKQFPKFYNSKMDNKVEELKVEEPKIEEAKPAEKELGMFEFRSKIVWFNAIGFLFMHLAGLYGIFLAFCKMFRLEFGTVTWGKLAFTFFFGVIKNLTDWYS